MSWSASQGTYIAGQEAIDSVDLIAIQMERKFGCDRLRLLVPEELRTRFDKQRKLTNDAILSGELDDVQRECRRMISAWQALERVADENPASAMLPTVWETTAPDGSVIQIVKEGELAGLLAAANVREGRCARVYTLEEVGRILSGMTSLYSIKQVFPGAQITAVRQSITDPLVDL